MKNLSKVILLCLMILSVSVNAGEKKRNMRRKTPCDFFGKILGAPVTILKKAPWVGAVLLFSPEAQAESWFCIAGPHAEAAAKLQVAAYKCDSKAVAGYLREGYNPSEEMIEDCYFLEVQGPPYNKPIYTKLPHTTSKRLAGTRGSLAKRRGDFGLLNSCSETAIILNNAIKERDL